MSIRWRTARSERCLEAAKAGFDGHIVKPVGPARLAEGMSGLGRKKAV